MNPAGEKTNPTLIVVLCDIRSAQNAGAILRTADAIGVSEVIFGGYTPGPFDRFGRERKEFTKASLGSQKSVFCRQVEDYIKELKSLKKKGAYIVALEQGVRAQDYKKVSFPAGRKVVLLGNEVDGLPKKALAIANTVAEIPMRGKKESLNVSVAAGIALFRWFDR